MYRFVHTLLSSQASGRIGAEDCIQSRVHRFPVGQDYCGIAHPDVRIARVRSVANITIIVRQLL